MKFETRALHEGQKPDRETGAVNVPVYQTSTYEQDAIGKNRGFEYSRTGNPTRKALEEVLAGIEGGRFGLAFASGLAATAAVVNLLRSGDHIVSGDDIYGGTYRLFEKVYSRWGLETTYVDVTDVSAFRNAIRKNTKMIWVETPTNPLLKVTDIRALSEISGENELILAVDNTFATPYFQRPLDMGADIVVHSTTKYIGGHSDIIGGAVIARDESLYNDLKFYQNAVGAVPGPMDCYLTLRGIKTLSVRMREHERNALIISKFLESHPKIERVYYPGLKSHPQHDLARTQMSGFSGIISIEIKGGLPAVELFLSRLKLFILAESLGGVESLVAYPSRMTHGAMDPAEREKRGIRDSMVRLSIGIEHVDDLLHDLEEALDF